MRYFDVLMEELFEEQIDTTKGELVIKTIIKPEAIRPDGVNKLDWEEDDYEEVGIYTPYYNPNQHQINLLKERLKNTDYIIAKLVEGVSSISDYADILGKRKAWREEINVLEDAVAASVEE